MKIFGQQWSFFTLEMFRKTLEPNCFLKFLTDSFSNDDHEVCPWWFLRNNRLNCSMRADMTPLAVSSYRFKSFEMLVFCRIAKIVGQSKMCAGVSFVLGCHYSFCMFFYNLCRFSFLCDCDCQFKIEQLFWLYSDLYWCCKISDLMGSTFLWVWISP